MLVLGLGLGTESALLACDIGACKRHLSPHTIGVSVPVEIGVRVTGKLGLGLGVGLRVAVGVGLTLGEG